MMFNEDVEILAVKLAAASTYTEVVHDQICTIRCRISFSEPYPKCAKTHLEKTFGENIININHKMYRIGSIIDKYYNLFQI